MNICCEGFVGFSLHSLLLLAARVTAGSLTPADQSVPGGQPAAVCMNKLETDMTNMMMENSEFKIRVSRFYSI